MLAGLDRDALIDILVIGGHGTPTSTMFAECEPQGPCSLDPTDEELLALNLSQRLRPGAHVILNSCSTGGKAPAGGIDNAEFVAKLYPNAWVHAPDDLVRHLWIDVDQDRKVKSVTFGEDDANGSEEVRSGYVIPPRVVTPPTS